jgi:gamma-glutamyl-gamma-aminobutyrate hydrolase PuuD
MEQKNIVISMAHLPVTYDDGETIMRDVLDDRYVSYWKKFKVVLIPIPNLSEDVESFLKHISPDGIIISGGMGVPAELWGEKTIHTNSFSEDRTRIDKALLDYAILHDLPVLGVCTGVHYMNAFFGGKLYQSMKDQMDTYSVNHVASDHDVTITEGDDLAGWLGNKVSVNSYHNQGIGSEMVADELKVFASVEEDNTVEALYHPQHAIAGVTWHPERTLADKEADNSMYDAFNEKLARAFLDRTHFWAERK